MSSPKFTTADKKQKPEIRVDVEGAAMRSEPLPAYSRAIRFYNVTLLGAFKRNDPPKVPKKLRNKLKREARGTA